MDVEAASLSRRLHNVVIFIDIGALPFPTSFLIHHAVQKLLSFCVERRRVHPATFPVCDDKRLNFLAALTPFN